jgi:hypothetical protein
MCDAEPPATYTSYIVPSVKARACAILAEFNTALAELVGRAVILTDGKAGTVDEVWLDEFHGLRISTIITASAATFVTYKLGSNQASIARELARSANANSRSAQQKLILDLFDKRWSIVTELREAIAEVVTTGTVSYDADGKFFSAANRAALLFGPEVTAYLCVPKTSSELMTCWNRLSWRNDRAVMFRSERPGLAIQVEVAA